MITIVAHHKIFIRPKYPCAIRTTAGFARFIDVGFVQLNPIDVHFGISDFQGFARQPDNTLDIGGFIRGLIGRIEDNNLTALRITKEIVDPADHQYLACMKVRLHAWPLNNKAHTGEVNQRIDCANQQNSFQNFPTEGSEP